MPHHAGIFRQRRQTYNTKSILRLYEPYHEISDDSFYKVNNSRDFNGKFNYYRKPLTLYSRRRKRRLSKPFQDRLASDQSTSKVIYRQNTKCDLTWRLIPKRFQSKLTQSTSIQVLDGYSSDGIAKQSREFTSTDNSLSSCNSAGCLSRSLQRKHIRTKLSQNIQAAQSHRNVSIMALVNKSEVVEKQTQKSEKVIITSVQEKGTDMIEYFTVSDLYCVEWIHKNLLEINLNPYSIVKDERIREASEITCYTSNFSS